uniref:IF rod domain-containing protein n=1 Tax=Leptobrachium leishanense TaxID=445787 RepID=A0A8C5M419_9ANUR
MIHVRGFGDEKSQLQELNNRLGQYLSRVRQLEEENQLLIEEIHRLRQERGAEWAHEYQAEMCQLRRRVEDLTVEKCEAEIQKENLCQELQTLQELWEQVRNMRIGIDKQLELYKQDLHQARSSQAALEELYIRLQQECQVLHGSNHQELLALRDQVLQVPLHISMYETASPRLSIQDANCLSLEFTQSWKDTFLLYQRKIEELENSLRLSEEERLGVEEEVRVHSLQVVEIRREYEELLGFQKMLEEELLRMKEKYRLEAQEYQIIIEELEAERNTITLTITERLRDYHELMQVKTGLSLEVAAYRALLEGENQKGTVIWTDRSVKQRPAGYVTSSFQKSSRYSGVKKEAERKEIPAFRSQDVVAKTSMISNVHRLHSQNVPRIQITPLATDLGRINSCYVSQVHEKSSQQKNDRSFLRHDLLKNRGVHQNVYETISHTVSEPYLSKQSTTFTQKTNQEQKSDFKPLSARSQPDFVRKSHTDTRAEDKIKEINVGSQSQSKVVEEIHVKTITIEDQKHNLEHKEDIRKKDEQIRKESTVSATEGNEERATGEPKVQEPPVVKERKKRDAKKKREQLEKSSGEMYTSSEMLTENESVNVTKTVLLDEKPREEQVVFNIPIKFEVSKKGGDSQKIQTENERELQITRSSKQTNANEGTTVLRHSEGHTLNEGVEKSEDKSPVQDKLTKSESVNVKRTLILDEKLSENSVVFNIPIKLEINKKENSSEKTYGENEMEFQIKMNANQLNVNEGTAFLRNLERLPQNKEVELGVANTSKNPEVVIPSTEHKGQPFSSVDHNVIVESKQSSRTGSVKTEINVQPKTAEPFDLFDEPDHVNIETRAYEQSKDTITKNFKGIYPNEGVALQRNVELLMQTKDVEGAKASCAVESEEMSSSSEHLGEKEMVADILKHFGQPSELNDPSVTFVARKQVGSDGLMKTEIIVESKTVEDVDIFDAPDFADLWNRSREELPDTVKPEDSVDDRSQEKLKKSIFGDTECAEGKEWIEDIVHIGLKGRPGVSVNVEIIEESIGMFGSERAEVSTPFHVEEAEDNFHEKEMESVEEELNLSVKKEDNEEQSIHVPTTVEEVAEGEDVDEEMNYFVSIPDDIPAVEDEEEETIKGQIHIEEESQVKYSWQDEFLQGSQGRKTLSEFIKYASSNEPDTSSHRETQTQKSRESKVVIEKEIKIPHEFQSSLLNLVSEENKDPREQLKGALDCLQGSIPQDLAEELAILANTEQTQSSGLAVDIKKVDQKEGSGLVTIVAEINVSQTVDVDDIDKLDIIERVQSGDTICQQSPLGTPEEKVVFLNRTEGQHLLFKNESDRRNESLSSVTKVTNNGAEHYMSEEIIKSGQDTKSPLGEISQAQIFTDGSRLIKHTKVDVQDDLFPQSELISDTEKQVAAEELSSETNRSTHHIKIGPRETLAKQQVIFEGPATGRLKLDIEVDTENSSDQNRSIRHIKISPTDIFPKEQIIFQGPIFKTETVGSDINRNFSLTEQFRGGKTQTIEDSSFNFEKQQTVRGINKSQNIIQVDSSSATNKTVTHFTMNSGQAPRTREYIFEGLIPDISARIKTDSQETNKTEDDNLPVKENITPIEHSVSSQKICTANQIKYQGFVSDSIQTGATEGHASAESQSNTSFHHIKLSPNKEQFVFQGPLSTNLPFEGDNDNLKDPNRSIAHIRFDGKEMQASEHLKSSSPITETYESSDFFVSSPSGDSTESERSIKHIKLGPTEKSFTFQMDITKVSTKYQGEGDIQESGSVFTSRNNDRQPMISDSFRKLTDDLEVAESGYGEEEVAGMSQYPYETEIQARGQHMVDTSEFDKTVQIHRIVHQSSGISDEKKVAVVYLEDEEEPDHDYLRRSF